MESREFPFLNQNRRWHQLSSRSLEVQGTDIEIYPPRPSSNGASHSHPSSPALSHFESYSGSHRRRRLSEEETGPFSWLYSPDLPSSQAHINELVETYFVHIHSLRSFGFIHKRKFMQQIVDWRSSWYDHQKNPLLLVVCALGAKFSALKYCDESQLADGLALSAGNQWAHKAYQLVFLGLNNATTETTMAIVLLHEHELRVGNYAKAFMLTGLGVRMAQVLQLAFESSTDVLCARSQELPVHIKEARRRLMWSVYIMDSWVGSGMDELTLIDEADIKIQLPCSDRRFDYQEPCITEVLKPESYLPFVSPEDVAKGLAETLDLDGHLIRLVSLRKKVLRQVVMRNSPPLLPWDTNLTSAHRNLRHLGQATQLWSPESEFAILQSQLQRWADGLPQSLRFTRNAICARKDASQLGGLLFCHFTYHQTMCDLTRIGMGDLFNGEVRVEQQPQHAAFNTRLQDQCFDHCMALCALFEEAMRHGPEALADTWLSVVAHDSARVIVHYISKGLGSSRDKGETFQSHAIAAVHSNLRALRKMIPYHFLAQSLVSTTGERLAAEPR